MNIDKVNSSSHHNADQEVEHTNSPKPYMYPISITMYSPQRKLLF